MTPGGTHTTVAAFMSRVPNRLLVRLRYLKKFFINILCEYDTRVKGADWRTLHIWNIGNFEMCERNPSDEIPEILMLYVIC